MANDSNQIDALEVHKKPEKLEQTVSDLQNSLGNLTEIITQYSDRHDQQLQTLSRHQREIHNDLFVFTEAPLSHSLREQVSQILQTLKSNQSELEALKQLRWRELIAKLDRTLLAFDQAKESIKPEKASKTPSNQPATNKVQLANTVEALTRILDDFRIAYEKRDLLHLKLTTAMSESRTRNLDLMFKIYTTIDTHTEIVSTSESQAKVKIIIDKLINKEGENITPNFIIRETTITIPKKDGKWGKIQW